MSDSFVEKLSQEPQRRRKKLLVIDDDPVQLAEHCKAMFYLDYDTLPLLVTSDMILGGVLQVITDVKPDGVLSDWDLNRWMKGTEIGETIKMAIEFDELPSIPVVLHSGNHDLVKNISDKLKSEHGLQAVFKKGSYTQIDAVFSDYFNTHPEVSYDRSGR